MFNINGFKLSPENMDKVIFVHPQTETLQAKSSIYKNNQIFKKFKIKVGLYEANQ
jgi:hypothetical protein